MTLRVKRPGEVPVVDEVARGPGMLLGRRPRQRDPGERAALGRSHHVQDGWPSGRHPPRRSDSRSGRRMRSRPTALWRRLLAGRRTRSHAPRQGFPPSAL